MQTSVQTLYRKLVTRVQRLPTTRSGKMNVPIFISCGDLPVPKHEKKKISEVRINDGLHYHAIALLPPRSRVPNLAAHFVQKQQLYLADERLMSVSSTPITDTPAQVVDYVLKAIKSNRLDYDEAMLVLPRDMTEITVERRRRRWYRQPAPRHGGGLASRFDRIRARARSALGFDLIGMKSR